MSSFLLKRPCLLTAIAMVVSVSCITVVLGIDNVTDSDEGFRRRLMNKLDMLCPYDAICSDEDARLHLNEGKESCCTECSCEDSCGLKKSCCYPEQASFNHFNRNDQQCEASSTIILDRMRRLRYHYMVTRGYEIGSEEDCGTGNATCGDNETASSLGSLYPVSSTTTGVIYKNEKCARCHGIDRKDMMPWEAVLTCLPGEDRVDAFLQSLEIGRVHDSCYVDFYYPGQQSELNVHLCYENTKRSCKKYKGQSYYLPGYLNMTDDEVRTACLTGPQALYKDFYNLFCYLCNYMRYNAEEQCSNIMEDLDGRAPATGSFSAFIDSSFLENRAKQVEIKKEAQIPSACKRQDGPQIDTDDCRQVVCPSGKVRVGAACLNPTKTLLSRNFKVAIKLYPGDNRNIDYVTSHVTSYLQQGKDWRSLISAPGIGSWRLSGLCFHLGTQHAMGNGSAGFLWLKLTLEKKNAPYLSRILANVDKFMTGDWKILVNMTSVPFQQRFSEFEDVRYHSPSNTFKPHYANNLDLETFPAATHLDWPELSCTALDRFADGLSITKTFFCDQVALKPEEFDMDNDSKVLYINATSRVFSPAEYSLGQDSYIGDHKPRLCLGDAGYVLVPKQNPASHGHATAQNIWLVLVVFVIAQLSF